jgi:hypothetical protein
MNDIKFSVTENRDWVTRKFKVCRGERKAVFQYAVKSFVADYLVQYFCTRKCFLAISPKVPGLASYHISRRLD